MTKASTLPWKKDAPKGTRHTHLSDAQKKDAKTRAKKAGRPYPNLIDNMAASRASKKA